MRPAIKPEAPTVKSVTITGDLFFNELHMGATLNGQPLDELLADELRIPWNRDVVGRATVTVTFDDED